MSFKAGDKVRIVSCEDDPRAAGKTGRIVNDVPPGSLTAGRWTVHRISPLIGTVLCHPHELRRA
ncbi:hypothetical protein ACFXOM_16755 [Streptomyces sp. NPDC059169]|uniref:hypothetical protein n=1 Tax=unclassified Streptomyces TaxID=2593676 RepID=UPI0036B91166